MVSADGAVSMIPEFKLRDEETKNDRTILVEL
jgi:hypothetical protein